MVFLVDTGGEYHRLESVTDIVLFSKHIAKLRLLSKEVPADLGKATNLYVFTTVYDKNLSGFLKQCEAKNISIFRSVPKNLETNRNRGQVFTLKMNQSIFPTCIGGTWLLSSRRMPTASKIIKASKIRFWEDQPIKGTYLCTSSF